MKKCFITVLSLLLALILLTACGPVTPAGPGTDTGGTALLPEDSRPGLYLNGVALTEYKIIYNQDDIFARFAAVLLQETLRNTYAMSLTAQPDRYNEAPYEILVGDTRRIEGEKDQADSFAKDQYALAAEGKKILLLASGSMVGGAVRGFLEACGGKLQGEETRNITFSTEITPQTYQYKEAKNVLLYIGDGMGANHIEWAKKEKISQFYAEEMPHQGWAQTYSASDEITDSAASATALATGFKTNNGFVGINPQKKSLKNLRELAYEIGGNTGVLTTDLITGATPGGFTVHVSSRNLTFEIETQQKALEDGEKIEYIKGDVGDNLLAASMSALRKVSEDGSPFFLMVEEGYIDMESHVNKKDEMLHALDRFNNTVAYAMEFALVRGDVLFVVTSDHETGGVTRNGEKFAFTTEDHTAADVRIFAMGQGAEFFAGKTVNNVQIPHQLAKVFGHTAFGDPALTEAP